MKIESKNIRQFTLSEIKGFDPITVVLEDTGPSAGRIILRCYNQAWTAYWSGMGNRTIAEFFASCDKHYLVQRLSDIRPEVFDGDGFEAVAKNQILKARRSFEMTAEDARETYDELVQTEISDPFRHPDLMQKVFGDEWWYRLPEKPNPKYQYLCRIVETVKEAITLEIAASIAA